MLLRNFSLFALLMGWCFLCISSACTAPSGTNFTRPPLYWCNVDVHVAITTICDTEVEEIITVPWATGMVNRFVPSSERETIEVLSAYRMINGKKISTYSMVHRYRPPGNVVISVRIARSQEPVTFVLRYKKTGAVQTFSQCSRMVDFAKVNSSLDNSLMLSKWAVGGRSVAELLRVRVRFDLEQHPRLQYVDTLTTFPEVFAPEVANQENNEDKPVAVIYDASTAGMNPSELFFYVRFLMLFGLETCPFSRNCEIEHLIFKESRRKRSNHKLILGLSLGLGAAFIVISFVAWVCCCKRIREKSPEHEGEEEIPASLTHFVYDTGDETQGKMKGEWVDANTKGGDETKEFYALDLSPRRRQKKGPNDF